MVTSCFWQNTHWPNRTKKKNEYKNRNAASLIIHQNSRAHTHTHICICIYVRSVRKHWEREPSARTHTQNSLTYRDINAFAQKYGFSYCLYFLIVEKQIILFCIRLDKHTYLPTKFSSTELLPADCPPTTAICGKSNCMCTPSDVNASCSLLTIGIKLSMVT